jgi:acyl transferase domain-containing protein
MRHWDLGTSGSYAGISSFSMSGTNAHIVIGAADPTDTPPVEHARVEEFYVSAKNSEALRELSLRYADWLADASAEQLPAFAYTASLGRRCSGVALRARATTTTAASELLRRFGSGHHPDGIEFIDAFSADRISDYALPRKVEDLPAYPWKRARFGPALAPGPGGDE